MRRSLFLTTVALAWLHAPLFAQGTATPAPAAPHPTTAADHLPRAHGARRPARRVRPLPRQQRPALLHARRPGRPREEGDQRQEHHPLQDAGRRHAHPVGALREPHRRADCPGRHAAQVRARSTTRSTSTSRTALQGRPHLHHRRALLRACRRSRAASAGWPSARIRRAATGSTPPTKARARACGGRARTSGATSPKAWTSASPCPNGLMDVSNGQVHGQDRSRRRLHALGLARALPDQLLQRVAQHRRVRAVLRDARRPAARLLRAARQPREGEGAVRPGQADDRGVREVRRASIRFRKTATS